MTVTHDVPQRLGVLVDELLEAGALQTPAWTAAFASVPRHAFVPRWYEQATDARGIAVWTERSDADPGPWLDAVYSDTTLVTTLDPETAEQVGERAWTGVATSSSTQPSLMAGMLEELLLSDGQRVLEIGTGTGYNAALLCARLGDGLVHSIDIDPALVRSARGRLAEIGYAPQLDVGDGQNGWSSNDRFDRIIATCSVPELPAAWVDATRPGGFILADIAGGLEGGLVRFSLESDGTARGRYTETAGRFMPARSSALAYPARARAPYAPEVEVRPTTVTAADIRSHYAFRLLLGFVLPSAELVYHLDDDGSTALQLQMPDGSWARAPLGGGTVAYGGSPELWRQVEATWAWWCEHGRPEQTEFGLSRDPDGGMQAWYVGDGRRWDL